MLTGAFVFCALAGSQGALYNNSTTYSAGFNTGAAEVGDEVVLSGSSAYALISTFVFQYWTSSTLSSSATAQVRFYDNNGTLYVAGRNRPGTLLWDSGAFPIGAAPTSATLTFTDDFGSGVLVPKRFTWTVQFSSLGSGSAGLDVFNPPTTGSSTDDYWFRAGSSSDWSMGTISGTPVNFGARFEGTAVPEPEYTGVIAAAGLLLTCGLQVLRGWRRAVKTGAASGE
jgi:hypothetical protein